MRFHLMNKITRPDETKVPSKGHANARNQGKANDLGDRGATGEVRTFRHQDYIIHMKDDGFDYLTLFTGLEAIKATATPFSIWNKCHQVFKFDYEGRSFVVKIDYEKPKYLENKFWELLTGSFYSVQMKAVNKAIRKGCSVVPDIFLVAEKKEWGIRYESTILMEFAPGHPLCHYDDRVDDYKDLILNAMMELHQHGLALGDGNCGNFILHGDSCKILDLSWHGSTLLGQAKDRQIFERVYGWHLPEITLWQKMAGVYIRLKRSIQHALSSRKRNRPNR